MPIVSLSRYVIAHSTTQSTNQYTSAGDVWWIGTKMCVRDTTSGAVSEIIPESGMVGLSTEAEELLNWVAVKKQEEEKIKLLCDKYPGLKDVKQKYDMMLALVQDAEK